MKKTLFATIGLILSILIGNSFATAQQPDAVIELVPSVSEARVGDEFNLDIILKNPGLQNIISVRSWIEFNVDVLEAVSLNSDDSPFTLSAPGETEISANEGLIKLGRSNVSGGFNAAETKLATVRFKVKTPYALTTLIEAYDYQVTELGHTSVNIIDQGFPVNILSGAPDPAIVNLNPGAKPYGNQEITPGSAVNVPVVDYANLTRPTNLRVMTGQGYADFKWDFSNETELMGYNLYYGKTSGMYTRRRSIGRVNQYRLEGLNNNEVYYFAITAYDAQNRESDYSDEVAIIINESLSSTSPFEEFVSALLANVPEQPLTGPLLGWVSFSAIGLGGTLAFRKKDKFI